MSEYNQAKDLIDTYYRRRHDELSQLQKTATNAAIIFVSLMGEKKAVNINAQVVDNLFGLVLAAVPGGYFLTPMWKALSKARPVFTDNIQYVASVTVDAIARAKSIDYDGEGITQSKTEFIAMWMKEIDGRFIRGFTALEEERTFAAKLLTLLDELNSKGYIGRYRTVYQTRANLLSPLSADTLGIAFQYMLMKEYTRINVSVSYISGKGIVGTSYKVSGLNDKQLNIIYNMYGSNLSKSNLKEVVEIISETGRKSHSGFNRLLLIPNLYNALSSQTFLKPVNDPEDLVNAWGAKLKKTLRDEVLMYP